jgi:hypothetical protein
MPTQRGAFSCKLSLQVRHETALKTAWGKVDIMAQTGLFFEILLQKIPVIFNTVYI